MAEITKFDKYVFDAISELIGVSPDGELTYTKILVCYLNGNPNKEIPWNAIRKSKVYGKIPKANIMNVLMSCNKLVEEGYITKSKVGGNYKYFLKLHSINESYRKQTFKEKLSKYKRYLLDSFTNYILEFCPSLGLLEHENYLGFINKNPIHFNEYNWFWITDDTGKPNSLTLHLRSRPNLKSIYGTFVISKSCFDDTLDEILDVLTIEKSKYKLTFNRNTIRPVIMEFSDTSTKKITIEETELFDLNYLDNDEEFKVFINNGGDEATNAALTVSECSPYKYFGATIFEPKSLQKVVQDHSNFEFSFLKWKVIAWSASEDNPKMVQNVLLVKKKEKNIWIVVSISKRKVLCITNKKFQMIANNESINSDDLLTKIFNN